MSTGEYTGRYRAFVRDAADPEKRGRVRCFCPSVMGETDNDTTWLGWADASYSFGGPAAADVGTLWVPEVGTPVWVEFQQGQPDFPVVVGAIPTGEGTDDSSVPKLGLGTQTASDVGTAKTSDSITVPGSSCAPVYPHNRVLKTTSGHILEVDETSGAKRIRVQHPSGTFVEMTNPGDFVKQVVGSLLCWVGSHMKVRVIGDAMLSAGGTLYLGGSQVSATKRVAHQDSETEDHDHTVTFILSGACAAGGGPVTGTITVNNKTNLKINTATCAATVKVKP